MVDLSTPLVKTPECCTDFDRIYIEEVDIVNVRHPNSPINRISYVNEHLPQEINELFTQERRWGRPNEFKVYLDYLKSLEGKEVPSWGLYPTYQNSVRQNGIQEGQNWPMEENFGPRVPDSPWGMWLEFYEQPKENMDSRWIDLSLGSNQLKGRDKFHVANIFYQGRSLA